MYAVINLPGSSHFQYYGPGSKKECQVWLNKAIDHLLKTEQVSSTLPRQIISNKIADSWKYRDGSKVFPDYFRDSLFGDY